MADIEVCAAVDGETQRVGLLRRHSSRARRETYTFEYSESWLRYSGRFALEPHLQLTEGAFAPLPSQQIFGAIGDSAPDTWGRRLMQRSERREAAKAGRPVRTIAEADYVLGVADAARMGALRFRPVGETAFQAPAEGGVPAIIDLPRLLSSAQRILRDEDTDEDWRLILAPGTSLGGARPKASVVDRLGRLHVAKFPKDDDEYSLETWEEIALRLAERARIETPEHQLVSVAGKAVLLSQRFDREGEVRIPFLSALALLGAADGQRASYPEIIDELGRCGSRTKADAMQLYHRVAFNVLCSNVDDHLRNHGFLRRDGAGWSLAPAYDLNPTPIDLKARVLSTNIDLDEGTCSIGLLESAAGYFGLALKPARQIIGEVARVTKGWRTVARQVGASAQEIERMASAFEHPELAHALAF
ncbi:MAG: type II toxin-antitoxin system HipA family toxin [Gammaproteobacteria bacterium]|nr:type II toxin-antitoxin system HipA family toxin [Gammaproteobacteria bacterium]